MSALEITLLNTMRALEPARLTAKQASRRNAIFEIERADAGDLLLDEFAEALQAKLQAVLDSYQVGDHTANGELLASVIDQLGDRLCQRDIK